MPRKLFNYFLAIIYMAVLCYVSIIPVGVNEPYSLFKQILHNGMHVPMYAGLTWVWIRCFDSLTLMTLVRSICIAVVYGVFMEYLQSLTPYRYASLMDVGLNTLGAFITASFYFTRVLAADRKKN